MALAGHDHLQYMTFVLKGFQHITQEKDMSS
jgi:hypothetical protein